MNNSDFLAIYANIGMSENLLTDEMPASLCIMQRKITKLMVICQGIFYAKHGKKLFDDSFLIDGKNKKEIDKIYFEFIKNYKGEIEERSFSHLDCDVDLFLDNVVKNYHDVPINDLDIELRRVYGFEYLNKKEKQALHFELDNNIFTYIDIIPVVFQLRYKRIAYRTAVNNIFWRQKMINENSTKAEVLEAVKQDGFALWFASKALKGDRDLALASVKQCGRALRYVSEELKGDKEVVLEAVKQWWGALQFVSEELRNDKEVVLAAVNEDGRALKFASEELQGDREVIMAEIKQNLKALLSIHGSALERMEGETKND